MRHARIPELTEEERKSVLKNLSEEQRTEVHKATSGIVEEADAREDFLSTIALFVASIRDLEKHPKRSGDDWKQFEPVPEAMKQRAEMLVARLAAVAFFPTAPKALVDEMRQVLEKSSSSKHLLPWKRALASQFDHATLLLRDEDGRARNPRQVVRAICLNVMTRSSDAPEVFYRLAPEPVGSAESDLDKRLRALLDRASKVITKLQRSGVQPPGKKAGGGRVSPQAAAAALAAKLGLDLEARKSRVGRTSPRRKSTSKR